MKNLSVEVKLNTEQLKSILDKVNDFQKQLDEFKLEAFLEQTEGKENHKEIG